MNQRELSGDECSPTLHEVLDSVPGTAKSGDTCVTSASGKEGQKVQITLAIWTVQDQSDLDETMFQK